jgi:hypothetical protein
MYWSTPDAVFIRIGAPKAVDHARKAERNLGSAGSQPG